MDFIICIIVLFFTVLNLVLYHKMFDVYYFSLGHGLAKEIVASVCVAIIETAILMKVGMVLLIILGVLIAIALILKAIKKFTGGTEDSDGTNSVQSENATTDPAASAKAKMNEIKDAITSNVQKVENAIKTDASTLLDDAVEVVPVSDSNVEEAPAEMFCPYCGEKILRTAKFCNYCGKSNSYDK